MQNGARLVKTIENESAGTTYLDALLGTLLRLSLCAVRRSTPRGSDEAMETRLRPGRRSFSEQAYLDALFLGSTLVCLNLGRQAASSVLAETTDTAARQRPDADVE